MSANGTGSAQTAAVQAITDRQDLSPADRLKQLLAFGNAQFGTSSGLVSKVMDTRYVVMHCASEEAEVEAGTEFALADTYCTHMLQAGRPLAFHQAGSSGVSGHPCYDIFRLETYAGAPVVIGGEIWGTVNFTAIEPRAPFEPDDLELLAEISSAVGRELVAAGQAA